MVVNQVQKEYSCTNAKMLAYCQEVRKLEGTLDGLELTHVLRNDNNEADELGRWDPGGLRSEWCFRSTASLVNN